MHKREPCSRNLNGTNREQCVAAPFVAPANRRPVKSERGERGERTYVRACARKITEINPNFSHDQLDRVDREDGQIAIRWVSTSRRRTRKGGGKQIDDEGVSGAER